MATRGLPRWPWVRSAPEDLPEPEAVLLDAARAWAAAPPGGEAAAARLPLATLGAGDAAPALAALLGALARPGLPGCRFCPRVTSDEAGLLLAIGFAQRGPRREALAALLAIAPPMQAYAAMGPTVPLGVALRRAGAWLAQPLRA